MKNQYFGDINDYRKYGLLKCIAEATGLPLGILWLLTADDGGTDGEFRRYLSEPNRWRHYDPELYDSLSTLLGPDQTRRVEHAAAWSLLPDATYFDGVFTDSITERHAAVTAASEHLLHCPLVFLDPDNGIEVKSVRLGARGSRKYVYLRELAELFDRGHSLVIYQHYRRISRPIFHSQITDELRSTLGPVEIVVFATPHVAFFLVLQPQHADHLPAITSLVHRRWAGQLRSESGI